MQMSGGKMHEVYGAADVKRRGIYTYEAPWTIYGMNWSVRADNKFRLAVGSFIEDIRNRVSKLIQCSFRVWRKKVTTPLKASLGLCLRE